MKLSPATRRLTRMVAFALLRGAATAVGSGIVGLAFWWITR
ncbi:hypothetical protein Aph01nite_00720 [Acrocarpospora phusangensis]|uniref:Uncharacterized protein n=1 Tax=Acrocarpospora phusangensis TaxID=1070424 RepID=A0A919Q8G2_9ACTN|nr:hypothetical protein [Acrocarpospora phusangensis]GIH21762.1 hypothetical protein Aph01nite_00720 [Acrocarpospora phusangensis]